MSAASHPYWRVSPRIWHDAAWNDDARLLALYLLTNEHRIAEGLYRLPKAYICGDLKWSAERLAEPFAVLLRDGFIEYDETASVVLVVKALKYQAPPNDNCMKAAAKLLRELPQTPLFAGLLRAAERYAEPFAKRLPELLPERYAEPLSSYLLALSSSSNSKEQELKDSLSESRDPDRVDRPTSTKALSAPGLSDWEERAADLLDRSAFPSDLVQLAELLAAENKTGKTALSRVVRELYGPLVEMEAEFSGEAMRHGLRAAITAQAPNANYVRKAAAKYKPLPVATNTAAGGDLSDYDTNFLTG